MADLTTFPSLPPPATERDPAFRSSELTATPLRGRLIELVPLALAPLATLYEIVVVGGVGITWRTRGRTVPLDEFAAYLTSGSDCGFAVADLRRQQIVGFVGLYGTDPASGVASLSAFFDQRNDRAGLLAADALPLFCRYSFEALGLRKLTIEMPAPIAGGLRTAVERLDCLTHEGTLRAHARFGQTLCDVDVYALWAADFLARRGVAERLRGRFTSSARPDSFALVSESIAAVSPCGLTEPLAGGHDLIDDLLLDSLALAELIEILEERSGCDLPLDAIEGVVCVQDVVTLLEHALAQNGSSSGTAPH